MSTKPTEGERLSEIQQRALRELVPTHRDATFDDIIVGQRKAMEQTAAEFAAPYLARTSCRRLRQSCIGPIARRVRRQTCA